MFNATIDDLEAGCEDLEQEERPDLTEERSLTGPDSSEDRDGTASLSSSSDDWIEGDESSSVGNVWMERCAVSTPSKTPSELNIDASPVSRPGAGRVMEGRIVKRRRKKARRLNYTEELGMPVPHEPNHPTKAKWKPKKSSLLRFVDNGFGLSKINYQNSYGFIVNGMQIRSKHAVQAQNVFRHLVREAEVIGMKVNTDKTGMVCFSDAAVYKAEAFIDDADGQRIRCGETLKALGMRFSSKPDMSTHVDWILKSLRSRLWMLRNLKRSGFSTDELVTVYKTIIRPVEDYGCVVYHSSLTDAQDEALERLQTQALKCIYGPFRSGRKLRKDAGLETLRGRRIELCDKFAKKSATNPCFAHWFPLKTTRTSNRARKTNEIYLEEKARCIAINLQIHQYTISGEE